MFVYNSNNVASLQSVNQVDIYYLDPMACTVEDPDGRTLVQSFPGSDVTNVDVGEYELDLPVQEPTYQVGHYIDEWTVLFDPLDQPAIIDHHFQIYPDLWYTTPIPVVYDFEFYFQPNKFRMGTKQFLEIEIIPNVPRASDLEAYYQNLAISAVVNVSIAQNCGECVPCEEDLRLVIDGAPTTYREKNRAFYYFDSTQFDCGVYDIWFTLNFGQNVYVSEKFQLLIFN
jgi:hypothetical protein